MKQTWYSKRSLQTSFKTSLRPGVTSQPWEPGTVDNARLAWCRLRAWMERSDITIDYPCTADLVGCFRYAHENAVSDVKNRHSQRCTIAALREAEPPFRRDSTKASLGQCTGLEILRIFTCISLRSTQKRFFQSAWVS